MGNEAQNAQLVNAVPTGRRRRWMEGMGGDGLFSPIARQIAIQIVEGIPPHWLATATRKKSRLRKHKACPKSLRKRVAAAFDRCEYCGGIDSAAVDRIVPRVLGGSYEPSNVTRACLACNTAKGVGEFIGPVRSLSTMEAPRG